MSELDRNETAKFVKYTILDELSNNSWEEEVEVPYETDGIEYVKQLLETWNNEEDNRKEINPDYHASHRKLLKINGVDFGQSKKQKQCNFRKINLVTIHDKSGYYDSLECLDCGMKEKRFLLGKPTRNCYPERTCPEHQKIFNSIEKLTQHNKKYHSILTISKKQITDETNGENKND